MDKKNNIELEQKIENASKKINEVILEVHKKIVGQEELIKSLLVGLF
jgi:hypothetical protein